MYVSNNPNTNESIGMYFGKAESLTAKLCPERTSLPGSEAAYPPACPEGVSVSESAGLPVTELDAVATERYLLMPKAEGSIRSAVRVTGCSLYAKLTAPL